MVRTGYAKAGPSSCCEGIMGLMVYPPRRMTVTSLDFAEGKMLRERFESLDGLRGIAAVIVVVYHFVSVYLNDLPTWFKYSPLEVLEQGNFCVAIFFVLSGFVIANSAEKSKLPLYFSAAQRYFRLAVPALFGTLWGWALFRCFPNSLATLESIHTSTWIEKSTYAHLPSMVSAVVSGLVIIFISGSSRFDGVLWTMKVELIGSVGVYAVYALIPQKWRRSLLLVLPFILALVLRKPEYSAFFIGAIIRELRVSGALPRAFAWPALVFGILIGSFTPESAAYWHAPKLPEYIALGADNSVWQVLSASAVIYATFGLNWFSAFLTSRPAQFLGKTSFGLYLVHWPLLFTAFVPVFMLAHSDAMAMTGLFIAFLSVSIALGAVFTNLFDQPVINMIRLAKKRYEPMRTPRARRPRRPRGMRLRIARASRAVNFHSRMRKRSRRTKLERLM
jgi:peptidoglycan/LPS O-acetylase OafA/YrhL